MPACTARRSRRLARAKLRCFVFCSGGTAEIARGRGTPVPLDPPRTLLARGPYRLTRNPMYLLYVAVAAAEALLFRSPALAAYAAALFAVAHLYVTRIEEPRLLERFGADYAAYARRVPRWLPRRLE